MTIMDSQSTPEPYPVGDRGNMRTDISDSFKLAFQDMAIEREGLRKKSTVIIRKNKFSMIYVNSEMSSREILLNLVQIARKNC